jgi:type VII secretion-associated protein (TIGR03931 family)
VWVRCRDDLAAVEEITAELPGNDEVLLDVVAGVPGSASTAAAIREILARRGLAARDVCLAERAAAALAPPRWRPAIRAALPVSAVLVVLTGLVVGAWRTPGRAPVPAQPVAAADSTSLVEGRIAVAIPPHWLVQRITAGPGSRRVQVSSPADADTALHITQSYAPETTLAEAAEVLGRAVADQPPGVFVDFRSADDVADRPAVTYREVRAGRVIRWSVVLDRSTRISIGCQSAPGHEDTVRAVCDQAVRSAHEVGTASRG